MSDSKNGQNNKKHSKKSQKSKRKAKSPLLLETDQLKDYARGVQIVHNYRANKEKLKSW